MRRGESAEWLAPHALYLGLGLDAESRFAAYRDLFRHKHEPGLVDEIRQATSGNFALGDGRFVAEVEQMLGRRVTRGKPGRPFKTLPLVDAPGLISEQ